MIRLEEVGGALAVCGRDGALLAHSPSGRDLFARMGVAVGPGPTSLPRSLWQLIIDRPVGEAVQWRPAVHGELLLGCTRYSLGSRRWLLVMSEITEKHRILSQRLHQQRLEAVGRLVATTVHDLRSPLASIYFNSDVLVTRADDLAPEVTRDTLVDIRNNADRLRTTIDCLLDYVRLGPPVATETSLKEVLTKVASLLRPLFRPHSHRLAISIADDAACVRGNAIAIEQIFVNLIVNAIEAAQQQPITVTVTAARGFGAAPARDRGAARREFLRVLVEDDGPGIPDEHRQQLFDPFFTTKEAGTGLGLSSAREAAREAGGDVQLVRTHPGAAFAVLLPASRLREQGAA